MGGVRMVSSWRAVGSTRSEGRIRGLGPRPHGGGVGGCASGDAMAPAGKKEWKGGRPPHHGMGENFLRADSDPLCMPRHVPSAVGS